MSKDVFSIYTRDRVVLTTRASREEINRLRGLTEDGRLPYVDAKGRPSVGTRLIHPHPKRDKVWYVSAGVNVTAVLAELRRNIYRNAATTEANQTTERQRYSTPVRAGRLYQHDSETCSNWHPQAIRQVDDTSYKLPRVDIKFRRKRPAAAIHKPANTLRYPVQA